MELSLTDVADDYYDDYLEDEDWEKMRDYDRGQHLTLDDVKEMIHEIRDNVRTSSHTQAMMGAMHSQDMKMAERNGEKVTMWSLIHLSFLLAIGIIQVVMIKSLFSDKSFKYRMYARMEEQGQMMQQQQADGSSLYMQ